MARLYSNLKFMQFPDRLQALREGRLVSPVHVRIKPINRCNHSCWYCAYRADGLQLGEDMNLNDRIPTAKMFELVEDLIAMDVKAVTFSGGGEPLLYKELPEAVRQLARAGIKVAALTNGSNLKGAMADAFAEHGTWLRVSLDAWDNASYSRSRGAPDGAFDRLLENLRAFAGRGSPCVLGASLIVGHDNAPHIAEVCALLKDAGVGHVKISGAVVANDVAENNRYHAAIAPLVADGIAAASRLGGTGFRIVDHYHELEALFAKEYRTCPFQQFLTVIGADCRVYTCQDKAYNESGCLGSIRDTRFRDFWTSQETARRVYGLDPSRDCAHHCIAHHKNLMLHEYLSIDPDHGCFV